MRILFGNMRVARQENPAFGIGPGDELMGTHLQIPGGVAADYAQVLAQLDQHMINHETNFCHSNVLIINEGKINKKFLHIIKNLCHYPAYMS